MNTTAITDASGNKHGDFNVKIVSDGFLMIPRDILLIDAPSSSSREFLNGSTPSATVRSSIRTFL
ncbi:hypothetical protein ACU8M5_10695 [Rhizobium leguminosarum]